MSQTHSMIILAMGAHFGLGVVIMVVLAAAFADPGTDLLIYRGFFFFELLFCNQ